MDLSEIKLDNVTYSVKDASARNSIGNAQNNIDDLRRRVVYLEEAVLELQQLLLGSARMASDTDAESLGAL